MEEGETEIPAGDQKVGKKMDTDLTVNAVRFMMLLKLQLVCVSLVKTYN